jgi:hypothetical protein
LVCPSSGSYAVTPVSTTALILSTHACIYRLDLTCKKIAFLGRCLYSNKVTFLGLGAGNPSSYPKYVDCIGAIAYALHVSVSCTSDHRGGSRDGAGWSAFRFARWRSMSALPMRCVQEQRAVSMFFRLSRSCLGKPVFLSKEKRLNTKAVSAAGHPLANSTSAFALFINLPARCQPTSPPFKHYARFGLHING